jgi:hypothetical protein
MARFSRESYKLRRVGLRSMSIVSQQRYRYSRRQKPDADEQLVVALRFHVLKYEYSCIGNIDVGCQRRWRE